MGQRVIPCAITAEYVAGDGVTLGAAGSHSNVVIEFDFRAAGPMWEGTTKYVLWTNPQGNSTNRVDLGVDKLVDGYDNVYHASPTADAMCVAGWAEMVVVGVTVETTTDEDSEESTTKEVLKVKTEPSRFRVLPGSSRESDNEGVAATVADQLQTEIEAVHKTLTEKVEDLQDKKVNKPTGENDPDGVPGQVLKSLGNGRTRWEDPAVATDEQVEETLAKHPEWTTTVTDGSISERKMTEAARNKLDNRHVYGKIGFLWCSPEDTPAPDPQDAPYQFGLSCVMWNDSACIVYDFGSDTDAGSTLLSFLSWHNIHKVDAVIISHYHGDHVRAGSVQALLDSDDVDTSDTVFYLPHYGINWSSVQSDLTKGPPAVERAVLGVIPEEQIVWPDTEGYRVAVGDFDVKFYNVSSSFWTGYYSDFMTPRSGEEGASPRYNNFSMCAMISIGGTKFFLNGDIEKAAQDRMADIAGSADGLQIPHHGVNLIESDSFIRAIHPDVAVLSPYSYTGYSQIVGQLSPITARCMECGEVVTTEIGTVEIEIDGGGLRVVNSGGQVTGASLGYVVKPDDDLNDLPFGYAVNPSGPDATRSVANLPSNFGYASYYLTLPINSNSSRNYDTRLQIGFGYDASDNSELVYRRKNGSTWRDWKHIGLPYKALRQFSIGDALYTTNYFTDNFFLSPRSVRGDFFQNEYEDLDDIKTAGFYTVSGSSAHRPEGVYTTPMFLIVLSVKASNSDPALEKRFVTQIAIPYKETDVNPARVLYMRTLEEWVVERAGDPSTWGDWMRTTPFSVVGSPVEAKIPRPPESNGNYTLQATVSNGAVSYYWVAQ